MLVDRITDQIITIVNKEIVHLERRRRYRTLHLDKAYRAMDELHEVLAKYGDICGQPVACPYNIHDEADWTQIFRHRWLPEELVE